MWNKKIIKRKRGALRVAACICAAALAVSPVPCAAAEGSAEVSESAGTGSVEISAPFSLEQDTNTAGMKGPWKDITPEGSLKGSSSYRIRLVWNDGYDEGEASDEEKRTVGWTSSNPDIASVDDTGLVTGHKTGHADITASWNGFSQTFGINVVIASDEPYTIKDGVLSYTSEALGKKYALHISLPSDGSVTWEGPVSDGTQDVLTVADGNGNVSYYLSEGKACTFRVSCGSGKSADFALTPENAGTAEKRSDSPNAVTVRLTSPATLSVTESETVFAQSVKAESDFIMKVGETKTLESVLSPSGANVVPSWLYQEQSDYWKNYQTGDASFENVVDFNGTTVTAVRPGTATFKVSAASSKNQTVSDTLKITVTDSDTYLFDDVRSTESYYFGPVYWAYENGITSGTSDLVFSPDQTVTRGQIVMFLWRMDGCPDVEAENPFSDVSDTSPFRQAILWAYENGIVSGTGSGTFSPGSPCTRAQIVTFLYRYAGSPEVQETEGTFTDVSDKNYYSDAVQYALENSITSGLTEDIFGSDAACTRAQAVTFLYRARG